MPNNGLLAALEQHALQSAFECSACRTTMEHGGERVVLRATWRKVTETICQRCWHNLMAYAHVGLKSMTGTDCP